MFGDPVAGVAQAIRQLPEIEAVAKRNRAGAASRDRREIENGEGDHAVLK